MEIRPAIESDAPGIARVHVRSWQTAYRGIFTDAFLDALSVEERTASWQKMLTRNAVEPRNDVELWVAEKNSDVIGWAAFGRSRDRDAGADVGELQAINIAPAHWRTGVGRELWRVSKSQLSERSFRSVTLWVLADNDRAIRFYLAAGFTPNPASDRNIVMGGTTVREIRYEMPLANG